MAQRVTNEGISNLDLEQGCFNMLDISRGRNAIDKQQKIYIDIFFKKCSPVLIYGLVGRILICRTYGMSNLIYSMTMLNTSTNTPISAHQEFSKCIWQNKPPKVKHSIMFGTIERGGIKTIYIRNMRAALLSARIQRL